MLKPKRIHVTPADIANGKFQDDEACPIALALQRAYPDATFMVGRKCVILLHPTLNTSKYLLPPRITQWIDIYDTVHYAEPIEFTFPSFEE